MEKIRLKKTTTKQKQKTPEKKKQSTVSITISETINSHNKNSKQDISYEIEPSKIEPQKQWHWKRSKCYSTKLRDISREKYY